MMQKFASNYTSKKPDTSGRVHYTDEENQTWQILYERQIDLLPGRACQEYMDGIEKLQFSARTIPQLPDVNQVLFELTGWQVKPVTALISAQKFFKLLANRCFPAATFIRRPEELDYVKEPDIFHELFGHCPMITVQPFADFMEAFGKITLSLPKKEWPLLLRLFWFTVEFGLIETPDGLRAYGGGILSSKEETVYCVESNVPERKPFDVVDVFRTPYRIDMLQVIYYIIKSYAQLYDILRSDPHEFVSQARELGEFPPKFPVELGNPGIYVGIC